jgi:hypothetical protein
MSPCALLAVLCLVAGARRVSSGSAATFSFFRSNTDPVLDDTGSVLDAHETEIVQWQTGQRYYLYGMKYALCRSEGQQHGCAKNRSACDFRTDHNVSVYSSSTLQSGTWHHEADILPAGAPLAAYFRGKVLHNAATTNASQRFVLWIFVGGGLVISTSATPTGPFALHSVQKSSDVLLHKTGDFSFAVDNQTAYVIYNANMQGIVVEQLSPDYLSSLGKRNPARYSSGSFGNRSTEAPVLFSRRGRHYALFDKTCCVCAAGSGVEVWVSVAGALGPYEYQGQVGRDAATGRTITSAQQCWVMALPGQDPPFIWIGDRWGSARDGLHGHDFTYWSPLRFDDAGMLLQFVEVPGVNISISAGDTGSRPTRSV